MAAHKEEGTMRWMIGWLVISGLAMPVFADDGSFSIRRRPFSLYEEEYEISEHGSPTGRIYKRPFSIYQDEYVIEDDEGNRGMFHRKPLSLSGDEWEFNPE